jgi:hypothetical protein
MHADTLRLGSDAVLVAAAVCPHPPLLIPQVAAGAAAELADLRTACREAITQLHGAALDHLVVVGTGAELRTRTAGGTLRPFGVDLHVGAAGDESLPLSLTVGAWLLEQARWELPCEYVGLAEHAGRDQCAQALADVTSGPERIGALVMADLSAKRTESAPGYLDERAEGFDRSVVDALASGDFDGLCRLDRDLAEELWCSGGPALVALGGAVRARSGAAVTAQIHYDAAPYGVGYVVASWWIS